MLTCPKCGYDNELGRIFCHSCGTKLDLSQIKPPTEGAKMRRRVKRTAVRTTRALIEFVIVGAILLVIALMCLTPDIQPFKATNEEMAASDRKRNDIDTLAAGTAGGKVVVTERDLNVYINSFTFEKPTGAGIEVTPDALLCEVKDGAVKIKFLGAIHFSTAFQKGLYLEYEGIPEIVGGHFVFKSTGAWFGKLPLAPQIVAKVPFIEDYFGRLFSKLSDDKTLIEKMSAINVVSNGIEFSKAPGNPAP